MQNLFAPIKQNKRLYILLVVIFLIFFLGTDLVVGFDFHAPIGIISIPEYISPSHILPFLDIEHPQQFGSNSYSLAFPRYLSNAIVAEIFFHPLMGVLYLINTILLSFIISYLITLIYAKFKRKYQKI